MIDEIFNDLKLTHNVERFVQAVLGEMVQCPYRESCHPPDDILGFGWYVLHNKQDDQENITFDWVTALAASLTIWLFKGERRFYINHHRVSDKNFMNYLTVTLWQKIVWKP